MNIRIVVRLARTFIAGLPMPAVGEKGVAAPER